MSHYLYMTFYSHPNLIKNTSLFLQFITVSDLCAILQEVILDINDQMNLITRDRQGGSAAHVELATHLESTVEDIYIRKKCRYRPPTLKTDMQYANDLRRALKEMGPGVAHLANAIRIRQRGITRLAGKG